MQVSAIVAELERRVEELEALTAAQSAALAVYTNDVEFVQIPFKILEVLSKQQRICVGALAKTYPKGINVYGLLDLMPAMDHTLADERTVDHVRAQVCLIRQKLGKGVIETIRGEYAYRLSKAFYETLKNAQSNDA